MKNIIKFNAAIYPKVITWELGKSIRDEDVDNVDDKETELRIDLPRGAYLIYLQNMFDEHKQKEIELFKKYVYGFALDDADYSSLLDLIMTSTPRNCNQSISDEDILSKFGVKISKDDAGKRKFVLLEDAKDTIRVETWEGIIIDLLKQSAMDIISCFDFESYFSRKNDNSNGNEKLRISLGAWKFSFDKAEQNLSNALRTAFMFTLVGYYSGDRKNQYNSFMDYFESEFYKRVSLVFGIWSSLQDKDKIKYMPLYDSFHNLSFTSKGELINILKGDMAFIGPRPLLVQYLPLYSEEQHHRHDVTPGMSGWAQVNGRNNISWTKKFELDVYYVNHIGPMMDLKVFFTTIKKVLGREDINTTTGQSATMDYFDGTN